MNHIKPLQIFIVRKSMNHSFYSPSESHKIACIHLHSLRTFLFVKKLFTPTERFTLLLPSHHSVLKGSDFLRGMTFPRPCSYGKQTVRVRSVTSTCSLIRYNRCTWSTVYRYDLLPQGIGSLRTRYRHPTQSISIVSLSCRCSRLLLVASGTNLFNYHRQLQRSSLVLGAF